MHDASSPLGLAPTDMVPSCCSLSNWQKMDMFRTTPFCRFLCQSWDRNWRCGTRGLSSTTGTRWMPDIWITSKCASSCQCWEDKHTTGPKDNVEEAWSTLKDSLICAHTCLHFISEKAEEPDWVTDAVQEVARKEGNLDPIAEVAKKQTSETGIPSAKGAVTEVCWDNACEKW